ncbi:hypothetical protein [Streptomyces sp. NPDC006631]|uniref:DUF7239 family protein n=1 Tax=Streptomyces sp. NPDC006631 TaxID=3364752 RepID=UPI00367A2CF6
MNMPITDDPRFERLPKWIKDAIRAKDHKILRLTEELDGARRLLNDGPEEPSVVVDPYSDNRQPMHGNPTVAFQFRRDGENFLRYFNVRLTESNRLEVHASAAISLLPSTNNSVKVEVLDR